MFPTSSQSLISSLSQIHRHAYDLLDNDAPPPPLPPRDALSRSFRSLVSSIPSDGLGLEFTADHLVSAIGPGLDHSALSAHYYGFVTGGVTPAALCAESLTNIYDTNVQVHRPSESVAVAVEAAGLKMLAELFDLDGCFEARTLTTGATAANVLGLACGREFVVEAACSAAGGAVGQGSVGELGLLEACALAGVKRIKVLSTRAHSCVGKAAGIVGLGRRSVVDVGTDDELGLGFDWARLREEMDEPGAACIVSVSCAEVNTGRFATSRDDMQKLREICDRKGAWLHVDAAFGIFARCLPSTAEFAVPISGASGLELADSIAGDGHKMLNVPYDCGFFLTRHKTIQPAVFRNANAAYLSGGNTDIPSPLNLGIENSRRFRGLPVYATLVAYGRDGYADMVARQVRLARKVAIWIDEHDRLELLPASHRGNKACEVFNVVLFRAVDDHVNKELVDRITRKREIYVSGTQWDGRPASRIAVSNWQADPDHDFTKIKLALEAALEST